jgi:hypothetical protein
MSEKPFKANTKRVRDVDTNATISGSAPQPPKCITAEEDTRVLGKIDR